MRIKQPWLRSNKEHSRDLLVGRGPCMAPGITRIWGHRVVHVRLNNVRQQGLFSDLPPICKHMLGCLLTPLSPSACLVCAGCQDGGLMVKSQLHAGVVVVPQVSHSNLSYVTSPQVKRWKRGCAMSWMDRWTGLW